MPPKNRGVNFSEKEISDLLDAVEEFLPIGQNEWENVTQQHSALYPDRERTKETLRRKYNLLHSKGPPTGDPDCPPNVRRAKRIYYDIKKKMMAAGDDNPDKDDSDDDALDEDEINVDNNLHNFINTNINNNNDKNDDINYDEFATSVGTATDDENTINEVVHQFNQHLDNARNPLPNIMNNPTGDMVQNTGIAPPASLPTASAPTPAIRNTRRESFGEPIQRTGSKKPRVSQDSSAMDKYMNYLVLQSQMEKEERKNAIEERRMEEALRREDERRYQEQERKRREEDREQERQRREEERMRHDEIRSQAQQQQHMMQMMMMSMMSASNANGGKKENKKKKSKEILNVTASTTTMPTMTKNTRTAPTRMIDDKKENPKSRTIVEKKEVDPTFGGVWLTTRRRVKTKAEKAYMAMKNNGRYLDYLFGYKSPKKNIAFCDRLFGYTSSNENSPAPVTKMKRMPNLFGDTSSSDNSPEPTKKKRKR